MSTDNVVITKKIGRPKGSKNLPIEERKKSSYVKIKGSRKFPDDPIEKQIAFEAWQKEYNKSYYDKKRRKTIND